MSMLPVSRLPRSLSPHALLAITLTCLVACGGGGGSDYGGDSGMGNTPPPTTTPPPSPSTGNTLTASTTFGPEQIFPTPTSSASATPALSFDTSSGAASGSVTLNGTITATAVTINDAFAGNVGPVALTLTQGATPNVWNVASGAALNSTQLADLLAGKLYVLVTSATYPNGELRGQILPANVIVAFARMSGDQETPAVTTTATGLAAATVNSTTKTAAINANTSGVATATGVEAHTSTVAGNTLLAVLVADSTPGHWLNENVTLADADLTNFNSSRWFVNVFTPAQVGGEIRGQIAVNPPTLATLQTNVFTPLCSACHNGAGSALPGVQNLTTAAATFAATVNVASLEQPALARIKPFNPDASYLVRKIEGDATITGSRMPAGAPLTQAQIDQVRAWTAAGAQNN